MDRMELIRGIVAAPVLPMTEEFEVDWPGLRTYLRWLVPQGPTAIAMNMDRPKGPFLLESAFVVEWRGRRPKALPVWAAHRGSTTRPSSGRSPRPGQRRGLAVFRRAHLRGRPLP
jgi:hypothetical protein